MKLKPLQVFGWLLIIGLVGLNIFLFSLGSEELFELAGEQNIYLLVFVIGSASIFSTFTGGLFYSLVIGLGSEAPNMFVLALAAAAGLIVSDSIFYHLATVGKNSIEGSFSKVFRKIEEVVQKAPDAVVYLITYLQFSFSPLPNDILMAALVTAGYSYKQIVPYIIAGSVTVGMVLVFIGGKIF